MDRYIFRGKQLDNGKWTKGHYYCLNFEQNQSQDGRTGVRHYIIRDDATCYIFCQEIDPETVGQCTGLKDKNGGLIFEGDIIRFEDMGETGYEYKEGYDLINQAVVEFYNGRWSLTDYLCNDTSVIDDSMNCHDEFMLAFPASEIIGNIHDKAESEDISNGMD